MDSFGFRTIMLENIRAFDKFAWRDAMDNPEEWAEERDFNQWFELFRDYMETNYND